MPGLCVILLMGIVYAGFSHDLSQGIRFVQGHNLIYNESLGLYVSPHDATRGGYQTTTIEIHDRHYHLDIAQTQESRTRGLSDRRSLCSECGMLFVFPESARHGFWMKDMHFPIDIIWLNADKDIVYIERHVSPDSYHTNPPTIWYPAHKAKYVIELPAGSI